MKSDQPQFLVSVKPDQDSLGEPISILNQNELALHDSSFQNDTQEKMHLHNDMLMNIQDGSFNNDTQEQAASNGIIKIYSGSFNNDTA